MWTLIHNDNIQKYFQHYCQLTPYIDQLCLHKSGEYVFLPRYFVNNFPSKYLLQHHDLEWKAVNDLDLEWNMEYSLRSEQLSVHERITRLINSDFNGGIIKARPGFGKTVVSIAIACAVRRKTLIILDNSKLVEQWIDAIKRFALFNGKQVTDDHIGLIQGNTFTTSKDTPFTIAMLQTLVSKVKRNLNEYYLKMKSQGFDLIYYDECHKTSCGPKFTTSSLLLNTKNCIGLSATPFADNLHKILLDNCIGVTIADESNYDLKPTINYVLYDSGLTSKYLKFVKYAPDMLRQRAKYNTIINNSLTYKTVMLDLVSGLLKDGHRIIIIVFTVKLVEEISSWLTTIGIKNRQFYSKQTEIDKEHDKVIVATYSFAGAGFDYKALSAAIIGTPLSGKKSLIQVIGRILRESEGKEKAIVYDLIDTGFGGMFVKDVSKKTKILSSEFDCKFNTIQL